MSKAFHNTAIHSNITNVQADSIPQNLMRQKLDIQDYTANQKTIVQNIFNRRNLNENLNFKNTFYLSDRGDLANKEANTIYGYDRIFEKEITNAGLKAQYASIVHNEKHVEKEKKLKQSLKSTSENVTKLKTTQKQKEKEEAKQHVIILYNLFRKNRKQESRNYLKILKESSEL